MRVLLITQGVSRVVLPLLESRHQVVGILESAPRGYTQRPPKKLVTFAKSLLGLFRKQSVTLKQLAEQRVIPYRFMTSSNDKGLESWIAGKEPDVILVYSMSQLLKPNIFSIPKQGTINLHTAYLPEYRGPNPDFWQYYHLEMTPGVTVHYVDAGEDTGDIILHERVEIPLGIKSPDRLDLLVGKVGVRLILEALKQIEAGSVERKQQPKESPTQRARNIRKEEHNSIIDWRNWPVERIWHVMRGTELWLDCVDQPTGLLNGQRWQVGDFERVQVDREEEELGKVMKDEKGFFVVCRDGVIRLSAHFSLKNFIKHSAKRLITA